MKRIDGARAVRDDLLAPREHWKTRRVGDKDVASFELCQVHAVLWSCRNFGAALHCTALQERLPIQASWSARPYTLDVWIRGRGVLSMAWNVDDDIGLFRMLRADWGSDVFRLSLPAGKNQPTVH